MSNYQGQPQVVYVERPSNTLGTAAFVLSLIAFLTAGCLSPISLILSLAAMGKQPKDMAVAGLVLSLIGCVPAVLMLIWLMMLGGFIAAVGAAASSVDTEPSANAPFELDPIDTPQPEQSVQQAEPSPPQSLGTVSNIKSTAAPLGGTRIEFDFTNETSDPISTIEIELTFVDSAARDEVLAKGRLATRVSPQIKPGQTQRILMRAPNDSPLNVGLPDTAVASGVVIKAE